MREESCVYAREGWRGSMCWGAMTGCLHCWVWSFNINFSRWK